MLAFPLKVKIVNFTWIGISGSGHKVTFQMSLSKEEGFADTVGDFVHIMQYLYMTGNDLGVMFRPSNGVRFGKMRRNELEKQVHVSGEFINTLTLTLCHHRSQENLHKVDS